MHRRDVYFAGNACVAVEIPNHVGKPTPALYCIHVFSVSRCDEEIDVAFFEFGFPTHGMLGDVGVTHDFATLQYLHIFLQEPHAKETEISPLGRVSP